MTHKVLIFLTFFISLFSVETKADEIWAEQFSVAEKGVWGDEDGITIHSDFDGISKWSLLYADILLENDGDYFKTVSTGGGRFEAVDINAEAQWISEEISITEYKNVQISFTAAETGSGNNTETKYLKAYYKLNDGEEILFAENGINLGNFGTQQVKQEGLQGNTLQIIVKFSTHYSSDKVYMDNILVSGEEDIIISGTKIKVFSAPARVEKNEQFTISGEIVDDEGRRAVDYSGTVFLEGETSNLSGTLEATIENGVCQWSNLSFNETGEYELVLSTATDDLAPAYHTISVLPPSDLLFSDDYESGFKNAYFPHEDWAVSGEDPISGSLSLKHNLDTVSGESKLFYPIQINLQEQTLEWSFNLKNGDWDPSSSNKFWVYLAANSENVDELSGYAVGVNIVGSTDLLSLWRINVGEPDSLIIETDLDWNASQLANILVSRSAKGKWELSYGLPLENFTSQNFKGEELTTIGCNYWGLYFKYSASRSGKLWFDDMEIKAYDSSPFIANLDVISASKIQVEFNEDVKISSLSKDNFSLKTISGANIVIDEVEITQDDKRIVSLEIQSPLEFDLILSITDFSDLNGNVNDEDSYQFEFFPPIQRNDLVISEIMADPSPVVNLPEDDFIELYNRASYPLRLKDWTLKVGDVERPLKEITLLPGEYLILCKMGAYEAYSNFGNTMSVTSFPGLAVKGANIEINVNGQTIDGISYLKEWYYDDEKDDGGWTLEKIDPNRSCGQEANWRASIDPSGGTPGNKNSVQGDNMDFDAPYLLWAASISPTQVELQFSEPMDLETLMEKLDYAVSDGIGNPDNVNLISSTNVILEFSSNLLEDKVYQLDIQGITDDCGNTLTDLSAQIQWVNIYAGDVVINEVLYDPFPEGEDFVELYNNSDKRIAFNRIQLASRDENSDLEQIYSVSEDKFIFEPRTYLLCTESSTKVLNSYYSECPDCFVEMPKFPSYVNGEGLVVLLADSTEVVDEFSYSDDLQSSLLYDAEGISLERIAFAMETNKSTTWHSAAEHVGYATPGYRNSQFKEDGLQPEVTFEPKSISPNNDGYNDQLNISYQLEDPGYVANIWIFDAAGRTVGQIAQNSSLGTSGTINWNGEDETGSKLPLGAYIIMVEMFDTNGNVKHYKEACILTDLLN